MVISRNKNVYQRKRKQNFSLNIGQQKTQKELVMDESKAKVKIINLEVQSTCCSARFVDHLSFDAIIRTLNLYLMRDLPLVKYALQ